MRARNGRRWRGRYWAKAGLQDRIELRLGAGYSRLQQLERGLTFDFAFIDAAKTEYDAYYELLLPRIRAERPHPVRQHALGRTARRRPGAKQATGRAIEALNHKLAGDPRVEAVLLSVADGIQFCRKR